MSRCAKCNLDAKDGNQIVEGGEGYLFCKHCSEILSEKPEITIELFMRGKKEGWVEKNMRKARERRAKGNLKWKDIC